MKHRGFTPLENDLQTGRRLRAVSPTGFIALTSVLILSVVLLVIAVGAGAGNFYTRMNMLEREFKAESEEIAASCIAYVQLALLRDASYAGDESVSLHGGGCLISEVTKNGSASLFSLSGTYKDAVTVYSVTLDASSVVSSEKEIPTMPS